MSRTLCLIALLIVSGISPARAADECIYNAATVAIAPLKRGVNLTRWWENEQNQALAPDDVKNLAALGFDFVRLPLSSKWLTLDDKDDRDQKLAQLRCDIVSLLNQGLNVIVDLHAPQRFQHDLKKDPDSAPARLGEIWQRLQPVISGLPPERVMLGLYNEPQIDNDVWWDIQGQLIQNLRTSFPHNTFIVTAGPSGEPWNLENVKPYADKNVIYDFHYYQPMFFTHHGASWFPADDPIRKTTPVAYPAEPGAATKEDDPDVKEYLAGGWNRTRLATDIDGVARWAKKNDVKIACLEFGVYRPFTDGGSRANWLRDMRELLEQNGIPWALWEYRGGFGLSDGSEAPDEGIVKALGLKDSSAP